MKTSHIITAGALLIAAVSIGSTFKMADKAHKAEEQLKSTQQIYVKAKDEAKSAHIASARQYYMLIHLSELAPEQFNRVADMAQYYSDADLVKSFDNVGKPIPKQPTKESSSTNTAATVAESATQSSTTNTENTTPESATKTASSNAATTATIPSYTGLTDEQFTAKLKTAGFTNITVSKINTPGSPAGYVFGCTPNTGSDEPFNKEIQIQVTQ